LVDLKMAGKHIAASRPALRNTLLNSARIGTDIVDYIVDETPEKIGRFSQARAFPSSTSRR